MPCLKAGQTCLLIMLLAASSAVMARSYSDPNLGFSIRIDDSFSQLSEDGNVFYFTTPDNSATVIVKNWPGLSVEAVRAAGGSGYQDEGLLLSTTAAPSEKQLTGGWGLSVAVEGKLERHNIRGRLGGFVGEQGQGFIILVAALPDKWPGYQARARAIFDSIRFIEYSGGAGVAKWKNYLTGMRLAYRSTYSGGSSSEDYYLCSDGSFLQSGSSSDFAGAAGVSVFGQSSNRGSGNWTIQAIDGEAHIVFRYHDGSQSNARLEDRDGKTLLNGSRYFVVNNDQCD